MFHLIPWGCGLKKSPPPDPGGTGVVHIANVTKGFHRQHFPYPQGCLTTGRRTRDLWSIPGCLYHS
ncbi:MAG: hypothetical protein ACFFCS_14935 [Candidatus Hodarchaeota archaeon]